MVWPILVFQTGGKKADGFQVCSFAGMKTKSAELQERSKATIALLKAVPSTLVKAGFPVIGLGTSAGDSHTAGGPWTAGGMKASRGFQS